MGLGQGKGEKVLTCCLIMRLGGKCDTDVIGRIKKRPKSNVLAIGEVRK